MGKERNSSASLGSRDRHTALQRPPEEGARWDGGNNSLATWRGWTLDTRVLAFRLPPRRFPEPKPSQEAAELSNSSDTCQIQGIFKDTFRKCSY